MARINHLKSNHEKSDHMEKKQAGKVWLVILVSLAGWVVDAGLATYIYSTLSFETPIRPEHYPLLINLSRGFINLLAFIWLPVTVIAGFRSWKKGFRAALTLVIITFIFAPLLVGFGFTMLAAAFG